LTALRNIAKVFLPKEALMPYKDPQKSKENARKRYLANIEKRKEMMRKKLSGQ
jgi:hypothetical protein